MDVTSNPVARVEAALAAAGLTCRVITFPDTTATAEDAARTIGTELATIVKSLVLSVGDRTVLVLGSGDRRVDRARVAQAFGAAKARFASPAEVVALTGFAVGGVPPVGHDRPLPVVFDRRLLDHHLIYAAAGAHNAVFAITPADLVRATSATILDLSDS